MIKNYESSKTSKKNESRKKRMAENQENFKRSGKYQLKKADG